jgi:CRP-like cAMP-binding protein
MNSNKHFIAQAPWAKSLTPEQVKWVKAGLCERQFKTGECVCKKGAMTNSWVGVIDGMVKLRTVSRTGKQASLITGIPTGSWFGEGSLLKKEIRKYDVVALRDSRIAFMSQATFFRLLEENIGFNHFLINHLNERLGQFIGFLEYDRLLSPDERVARSLASMFNPHLYPGSQFELQISQEELGSLAGVSRQRVNQTLQVLQDAGILSIQYGSILIKDVNALQSFENQVPADTK